MNNILISNQKKFEKIINNIKKWGFEKLHIISDFDRTLTKAFLNNWEFVPSLISILRDENYLSENYTKNAKDLFEYYHKIELDNDILIEKKKEFMQEWWTKHS